MRTVLAVAAGALLVTDVALASGFAPLARDDSATVARGGVVSVLDSGQLSVLANDFDVEGDQLRATLVRAPQHGTVTLNADGTFLYRHDGSSKDSDEFRYRAFDGTRFSRHDASVSISVTGGAPVAPQIVGQQDLATPEDQALTVSLQDLIVEDPDSRYPQDFTLTLKAGADYSVQGTTVRPDLNFNGTLTVPAQVNDGQLDSNEFALKIRVDAVNDAPSVVAAIGDQEATEGEPFSLDVAPAFADPDLGDALAFTAAGLPASGSLRLSTDGMLTGVPLDVDTPPTYQVTITATDRAGATAATSFALRIHPRRVDLAVGIRVEPDPATVGAAPLWYLDVTNLSSSSSDPVALVADWYSSGAPVTLSAPPACGVADNSTAHPQINCAIPALSGNQTTSVLVQSAQSSPGDQGVLARLEFSSTAGDANGANDAAFKGLNLAGSFSEGPAERLLGASNDLALADLDRDGREDLVAVAEQLRIFFGTDPDGFDATPLIPSGASAGDVVAVLDWNRDSLPDIVVLSAEHSAGRVFLNDGARNFVAGQQPPAVSARAAVVADFDLDGFEELAVAGDDGTALLKPDGSLTIIDGRAAKDIATADFDADGRMDLAVALADNAIAILRNTTSGFVAQTLTGFGSVSGVSAADLTGDGAPDLLLAIDAADLNVPQNVVLENDGSGAGFAPLNPFGVTETRHLLVGDVNGDGVADVVSINASGVHQVYFGDGGTALQLQPQFLLSPGTDTARLADIDGDGALDLVVGGPQAPSIEVLRNNGIGRFGLGDVTPPVIKLLGTETVSVEVTSTYVDPGATATDDVSGDLTPEIVVNNPVDTSIIGSYLVSYDVTDRAGNASPTQYRTVVVKPAAAGGGGGGGAVQWYWLLALALSLLLRRYTSRARPASR